MERVTKELIERVEAKLKKQSYINLAEAKRKILKNDSGFYWIFTKLPMSSFSVAPPPSNKAHADFSELSKIHDGLKSVISQNEEEYWCIYNGKGKKLNARLVEEFKDSTGPTGKLALLRCFNESDFMIKYIICGSNDVEHGITEQYADIQRDLERAWRLHYNWPFLCRT